MISHFDHRLDLARLSDWIQAAADAVVHVARERGLQPAQLVSHYITQLDTTEQKGARSDRSA